MSQRKRVAITGIGIVSPLGNSRQQTWENLIAGQSGIDVIQHFDASAFPCHVAAEVKQFKLPASLQNKKYLKYTVPLVNYALAAAEEAFQDADLRPQQDTATRWGLVTGSGMMNADFDYWRKFTPKFAADGKMQAADLPTHDEHFFTAQDFGKTTANIGISILSQAYGIQGYINSVHTACASSGQALGLAMQVIRRGDADYVLAGGFESMINPVGLSSFCLLGALSDHNDPPAAASRPFDLTRNGFILGEGSAFLILEDWHKAIARGVRIYAELAGEGNALSSYRITDSHPSGDGAIQALTGALQDAQLNVDDIDYINAHGTGTVMNDLSETNAFKAVLKKEAVRVPVSSTKGQTGHLIAAAGALEAAITALAIHHSTVPATANLNTPDPECDLDYVAEGPRQQAIRAALSTSFGFGGSNSCVALRHPDEVKS